jgi:hypothetical protein
MPIEEAGGKQQGCDARAELSCMTAQTTTRSRMVLLFLAMAEC